MKKLEADRKLMAYLGAILLMTAMLGAVSYYVLSHVNKTFETAVNSTARKLWLAGDINMSAGDMLAAQRGTLLFTDDAEIKSNAQLFDTRSAQVDRDAAELRSLSADREELQIIDVVEASNASYRQTVHRVVQHHTISTIRTTWRTRTRASTRSPISSKCWNRII